MKLSKVELLQNGLKGMKIAYADKVKRGGYHFEDKYKDVVISTPVPHDLKELFYGIRKHVLNLATLDKEYVEDVAVTVVSIESNEETFFKIKAKLEGLYGDFVIELPQVEKEQGYPAFNDVMLLVKRIYDLAAEHKNNYKAKADVKQTLIDFSEDKKFAKEMEGISIDTMSIEEQTAKYKELLVKAGCIIIDPNDMGDDIPVKEEKKTNNSINNLEKMKVA